MTKQPNQPNQPNYYHVTTAVPHECREVTPADAVSPHPIDYMDGKPYVLVLARSEEGAVAAVNDHVDGELPLTVVKIDSLDITALVALDRHEYSCDYSEDWHVISQRNGNTGAGRRREWELVGGAYSRGDAIAAMEEAEGNARTTYLVRPASPSELEGAVLLVLAGNTDWEEEQVRNNLRGEVFVDVVRDTYVLRPDTGVAYGDAVDFAQVNPRPALHRLREVMREQGDLSDGAMDDVFESDSIAHAIAMLRDEYGVTVGWAELIATYTTGYTESRQPVCGGASHKKLADCQVWQHTFSDWSVLVRECVDSDVAVLGAGLTEDAAWTNYRANATQRDEPTE